MKCEQQQRKNPTRKRALQTNLKGVQDEKQKYSVLWINRPLDSQIHIPGRMLMSPNSSIFPHIKKALKNISDLRYLFFAISSNLVPRCMLNHKYFLSTKFIYILVPSPPPLQSSPSKPSLVVLSKTLNKTNFHLLLFLKLTEENE